MIWYETDVAAAGERRCDSDAEYDLGETVIAAGQPCRWC
jgi:hypothetical protein